MTIATIVLAALAPTWASVAQEYKVPEWFEDAKFGIFCHWSVQCVAEDGDWYSRGLYGNFGSPTDGRRRYHTEKFGDPSEYGAKDLINDWKAEKFDPEELCALWKKMGARYIVALANHHDNFDNWDSKYQPWNSVNMGPKRDLIGDWSKACLANGMRFGVSVHASHAWTWMEPCRDFDGLLQKEDGKGKWWEGYDPQDLYEQMHDSCENYRDLHSIHGHWNWGEGCSQPSDRYVKKFKDRTMDLVTKYKPDVLYFDDTVLPFYPIRNEGFEILNEFYELNKQWHGGRNEGVVTGKVLDEVQRKAMIWDVERGVMNCIQPVHWQTCTCLGDWHYRRALYDWNAYKKAEECVRLLCDITSKNGNLILSVPMRGDGSIDDKERAICEDIAAWTKVNGEAIFATRPWKVFGDGPNADKVRGHNGAGFNEYDVMRPEAEDVRYTRSKDGKYIYGIALKAWPEGKMPAFKTLRESGITGNGERFPQVKNMPSVWKFLSRKE